MLDSEKSVSIKRYFVSNLMILIGKECWSIVAGKGTGSVVSIDFGIKIARKRPLRNTLLSDEQRQFEPELSLFVKCAWRINSDKNIICSSTDSNSNDGPMVNGLKMLVGHKVKSIDIEYPALDLKIIFDNDLRFYIFCNETNIDNNHSNYTFSYYDMSSSGDSSLPIKSFTVESRSSLEFNRYER